MSSLIPFSFCATYCTLSRNGNATRYVYDGNGNIVKTIDALGTESVFTYNKNDQLISTDLHRVDALNGVDSHEITLYAKKASVTNSNATNNNYFMKVPKC